MEDEDVVGSLVIRSFSSRGISIALIDMLRTSIDMLNKSEVGALVMGASIMGSSEDQVGSKLGLLPNLKDGLLESLVVAFIGLLVSSKVGHGVVGLYVGLLLVGSLVISPRRSSSSRGISIAPIDMLISLS